jgi:aquaporin Z
MSLLLNAFLEFVGTFAFVAVILLTSNPIAIGLTLTSMIYLALKFSGGMFNPAVSFAMLLNKKINTTTFITYCIAQLLAAGSAFALFKSAPKA